MEELKEKERNKRILKDKNGNTREIDVSEYKIMQPIKITTKKELKKSKFQHAHPYSEEGK